MILAYEAPNCSGQLFRFIFLWLILTDWSVSFFQEMIESIKTGKYSAKTVFCGIFMFGILPPILIQDFYIQDCYIRDYYLVPIGSLNNSNLGTT